MVFFWGNVLFAIPKFKIIQRVTVIDGYRLLSLIWSRMSVYTSCWLYKYWYVHFYIYIWLVVSTPPKNISQLGLLFPIYGTYKKCSKPPTRLTSKQTEQLWIPKFPDKVPGKNTQRIERAVHIYIYTHNMNWEQKRTTKTRAKICKRLEWSPRKYWGCPRWSPLSGWFLIQPNLVIQYVW